MPREREWRAHERARTHACVCACRGLCRPGTLESDCAAHIRAHSERCGSCMPARAMYVRHSACLSAWGLWAGGVHLTGGMVRRNSPNRFCSSFLRKRSRISTQTVPPAAHARTLTHTHAHAHAHACAHTHERALACAHAPGLRTTIPPAIHTASNKRRFEQTNKQGAFRCDCEQKCAPRPVEVLHVGVRVEPPRRPWLH